MKASVLRIKEKPSKACQPCVCGSGVTLRYCRNPDCTAEGKGSSFCKDSGKKKLYVLAVIKVVAVLYAIAKRKYNGINVKRGCGIDYEVCITRKFSHNSLKQISKSKTNKHKYVKLSSHEFRIHIEKTFKEGMTWDNYGQGENKWTIGHAKPIMYKNPTDEQIIDRLHYTNTFAQWWSENQEQGNDKIVEIDEKQNIEN